ncbi:MAG: acetate--CoA ligase family protein [Micromonosporaceae bacterium]
MSAPPAAGGGTGSGVHALFNPRSIALVGAADKSGWSLATFNNLRSHGFTGEVYLVNSRTDAVHGHKAYRSLSQLPCTVDLAYVMVPTAAVLPLLREGAGLGIRCYVILTAGFAERGPEGRRLDEQIAEIARARGLVILGPNGNGYVNAAAGITPYGLPIPQPLTAGPVGVVLQSGALASSVLAFAQARNVGISLLTSMGNETVVSVTDVVDYLIDDPATLVIALFLETVRRPGEFARVARRALRAGKPIVALKVGRSEHASQVALAHTGALVGDDAVVDAAFRQLGVVRVRSVEDLIVTAGLLVSGPLPGPRIGVVTPSGGASGIIADRAEDEGLQIPAFGARTVAALTQLLPEFATVRNPLDVTGYVVVDRTLLGRALEIVAADPGIDVVLLLSEPPRVRPPDPAPVLALYEASARRISAAPRPVVVMSTALTDVTAFGRDVRARTGFPYVAGGIEHGMHAVGAAVRWSQAWRRSLAPQRPPAGESPPGRARRPAAGRTTGHEGAQGVWAEDRAAAFLADHGVPIVPSRRAPDEAAAVAAAESFGYPVVLKAAAGEIAHKSEAGAVRLGLAGSDAVRRAHRQVLAAARAAGAGEARILVQPQRSGGIELLAGVIRDPSWGLVLAVGLGGIWVEVLRDTALRLLPADAEEVRRALGELRGAALFRGARGTEPADLGRVAEVIARLAALAAELGDQLESLEVNPLFVRGSQVEALDALITWRR